MAPYLILLAIPALPALAGVRRAGAALILIAALYWVMIGLRFHVGMDWDNYLHRFAVVGKIPLGELLTQREPGFAVLLWLATQLDGGIVLVNAVSALVFCWGFFAVARRCREPYIAIAIGTPLLVVAFAMSGIRQALALGIIYYLFATWEERRALSRILFVAAAALFHFSAVFVLVFVALAAKVPLLVRVVGAGAAVAAIAASAWVAPGSFEAYSELYVTGERRLEAPGALMQLAPIAAAALLYIGDQRRWREVLGEHQLYRNLAVASLFLLPVTLISSVGAYRLALYLWPLAMYVWAGLPALSVKPEGQLLTRLLIVAAAFALLVGWLTFANNSSAWFPYENWISVSDGHPLLRRRVH